MADVAMTEEPALFPCVLLVVGDNSRGMDRETRQRLFEPFFTLRMPGKERDWGSLPCAASSPPIAG